MQRLKPYDLTKGELLMVLNLRPSDLGFLDCVVEECDERFTGEQQQEIIGVIAEVLGEPEEVRRGDEDNVVEDNVVEARS